MEFARSDAVPAVDERALRRGRGTLIGHGAFLLLCPQTLADSLARDETVELLVIDVVNAGDVALAWGSEAKRLVLEAVSEMVSGLTRSSDLVGVIDDARYLVLPHDIDGDGVEPGTALLIADRITTATDLFNASGVLSWPIDVVCHVILADDVAQLDPIFAPRISSY